MSELKNKLTVSASPHVRSNATTKGIMLDVIIALMPALAASVFLFGPRTLAVTAVCVAVCVLSEYLARRAMKKTNTIGDLSAVVTGLLLAFNLPSGVPLWIAAIGSIVAIVIIKAALYCHENAYRADKRKGNNGRDNFSDYEIKSADYKSD